MAGAGTVEIDFAAETAKFTAELKKVRADLNSLGVQVGTISKSLTSFGTALKAAFVSAGIVAGIRAIVTATEESEAAITQLNAALKNSSAVVRLSSADFQAFAKSMQATTTFTDEAVTGVETVLLAFRSLSGQTILSATSAVLDLSTRLGTDLTSSAKLVGRALEDPEKGLTALARAGVVFSKSQQDLIKHLAATGDKAQAQGIILAELEKRYGGAAAAARDTLGGALKGLENSFGDLLEGDNKSFSGATKSINELTRALGDPRIKQGFDNLIKSAAAALTVTARLAIALTNLGRGIGTAFIPKGADLKASEALRKELNDLQDDLTLGLADNRAASLAYIETLKARIVLAEQLEGAEKRIADQTKRAGTLGGHGPIKRTDIADPDEDAILARLKQQEAVLEIREKALTASINSDSDFLDSLDRRLGDGQKTLTQLDEDARKERAKSRADVAKDALAADAEEFDHKLRVEQQFTDQATQEAQKRLQNEIRVQKQLVGIRQDAVVASVAVLAFLVSGHGKASKAIAAAQKAAALISIYRNTAEAASKALTLGPILGPPAAAAMIAFGAIQAAAVLSERSPSQRGGGRSSAFDVSTNSPGGATQTAIASQPLGAQQKPQTTINVFGWSESAIRDLVRRIKDEVGDHDLTLIRQGP